MTTNMTIYEGAFVNIETNLDNENIQQIIVVRIFDTETVTTNNPHNARYRVVNNGDGTQTVFVTWDQVDPALVVLIAFGYDDGGWQDTTLDLEATSAAITIPEGDYTYSFVANETRYESALGQGAIIPLEMAEPPVKISVVDNDEDKFTPIRSKQAEIQIYSSNNIDISTFSEGGDNRFYVEIETQFEGIIFIGHLSISDLQQEFLPDPNLIVLVASDGLGFLKDEPLVNFLNETPLGIYPIIDFLAWALNKTGLALDIKVCMNIREHTSVPLVSDEGGAGHLYTWIYLDAKTFESEIGECEDCYQVLTKILGENSFLVQYKGEWVIIRVDEMETGHEYFFSRYSSAGVWIENTEETFIKNIGASFPLSFMNDDCVVSLERPYRDVIETFNYNYPQEIVCNNDFERGEFIEDMPDETIDGVTYTVKSYEPECWTAGRFYEDSPIPEGTQMEVFTKKLSVNDYEKTRYVVLKENSDANPYAYLRSSGANISKGDQGTVSVDFKFSEPVGDTTNNIFGIMLVADNGDVYNWSEPNKIWVLSLSHANTLFTGVNYTFSSNDENTHFNTATANFLSAPAEGRIYIFLTSIGTGRDFDSYYSNIRIEISPLINGSYRRYLGQTHTVSQGNINIKAVRETEVFISDAPRIAMKGALLKPGAGATIYEGEADFGTLGQIEIDGNFIGSFPAGLKINVTGSGSNNIIGRVISSEYSILGDLTTIFTDQTTTTEINADVIIKEDTYVLATDFYNAAKHTAGPANASDIMPFGQIQAFDVWNQYNRVMRKFEATVDKTDSTTQIPDLLHKYILQDVSMNTTNGSDYRIFQLLHFEMDLHLCQWGSFFHEVFKTDIDKIYETHEFKYITE